MNFTSIIYSIVVLPIESFIEFVFCFTLSKFDDFGVAPAIFAVSLTVNFLALPIYNVADKIQLNERNLQQKMSPWVKRIKSAFKGDEQFMILSTYYRQNNYHPIMSLRQSLSVLIQIPFFIAAYHFLSNTSLLDGQSILFLKDLSQPDAMLSIPIMGGGTRFAINVLPIIMTAINVASLLIYTKGAPFREKIQAFALALIFLVLLYDSPSGLVFYWILNQIFSLCKNIVLKTKHPWRILYAFLCAVLLVMSAYLFFFKSNKYLSIKCAFYFLTTIFIFAPFILKFLQGRKNFKSCESAFAKIFSGVPIRQKTVLMVLSCAVLWLLCGLLLPSNVIATSPAEFAFLGNTDSPISYICSSLAFFAGLFVFWPLVIYKMFGANEKVRSAMPAIFFVLAICALANAFLFKHDYGTINIFCQFDNAEVLKSSSIFFSVVPLLFMVLCLAFLFACIKFKKLSAATFVLVSLFAAQIFMGAYNVAKIKKGFKQFSMSRKEESRVQTEKPSAQTMYSLSKNESNVFILFLDRAISDFFPYILKQFPELEQSFDGFEYYPNCLSFADFTNCGVPAMAGGYDYSIDEINKRSDVTLKDKYNEALMTLPLVFEQAGYESAVFDLPYEDYDSGRDIWAGTNVKKLHNPSALDNFFEGENLKNLLGNPDITVRDNIKYFSILQILFPFFRIIVYDNGKYCKLQLYRSLDREFLRQYTRLHILPQVTSFDNASPTFHFVGNTTTHEYTELPEGYVPGIIDETHPAAGTGFYNATQKDSGSSESDYLGYHSNAAAILQVGKWLDYLKENDCYDNTRIIIVADHGRGVHLICFEEFENWLDAGFLNPLLLFKDFNSHGKFVTDYSIHTNADVPYLATKDLSVSNVNPFTNKEFRKASDFSSFNVYRIVEWRISQYKGKTQFPIKGKNAYTVRDNIFDEKNWTKIDTSEVEK